MRYKMYNARLYDPRTGSSFYVRDDDKTNAVNEINSFLYIGCRLVWSDFSFI